MRREEAKDGDTVARRGEVCDSVEGAAEERYLLIVMGVRVVLDPDENAVHADEGHEHV